jgi:hypothetical protein
MQPFTFDGQATVMNINLRAEDHGEDKVPAFDVKLAFVANDELCANFDPVLKAFFYNEQGFIRNKALRMPLKLDDELEGYELRLNDIALKEMTLSKFEVEPGDGRALHVTCSARGLVHDSESTALHPLLMQTVDLKLKPQQESLL